MYRILGLPFGKFLWMFWPLRFILRFLLQPSEFSLNKFREVTQDKDVIFVLPRMSIVDVFVLNLALKRLKIPKVTHETVLNGYWKTSVLALKPPVKIAPFFLRDSAFLGQLSEILEKDNRVKDNKIVLFPVSVFWGRVPERIERNMIFRMLFPDDGEANTLQKIWIVLLHCRNVHVHFGSPLDIQSEPASSLQKKLFEDFKRERTAALGPSLYDFQTMADHIINLPSTKHLLANYAEGEQKGEIRALNYLSEITANYHYLTVESFERLLDFIWTRIFKGVRVRNFDKIATLAKQGPILWMPCHRSHLDYLLLSYLLKKNGLAIPHIAAGVNLNFWPIGPMLRRCGAFFLRRSFAGNKIYSHVFSQYVDFLMSNNFPVEFFQEAGRTRIGKLLLPKRGLLSICVGSMIKRKSANTYMFPVYFGYEKVLEDAAYAQELQGAKKNKESIFQLLLSLRKLFSNYGRVDVSFGEPLKFGDIWHEYFSSYPNDAISADLSLINDDLDARNPEVQKFVKYLSYRVNEKINKTATASGSSLLASILLTSSDENLEKQVMRDRLKLLHWTVAEIRKHLNWNIATSAGVENSADFYLAAINPAETKNNHTAESLEVISLPFTHSADLNKVVDEILEDALRWGFALCKEENANTYSKNPQKDLNLWWYRGTIFHVLCIPGLIATILIDLAAESLTISEIEWWVSCIRRLWAFELFWPSETSSLEITQAGVKLLSDLGILTVTDAGDIKIKDNESGMDRLYFFADLVRPERELYSLQVATAIFLVETKGSFTRDQLISRTHKAHHVAFLRGAAIQPASLSEVFGGRVFDALLHEDIFISIGNNSYSVSSDKLIPIFDFFETPVWRDFLKKP